MALLLDEFGNLGRIPDFTTTITVARDRGVQLMLGIQALSQLDGLYGETGARTIRTNCGTKIVLHGLDEITGEEVSPALGETTVQHEVQTRTPEGWNTNTYTYAEHHDQRRLLTSDEVRRIGIDEAIIIVSNFKPIRARRHHWTEPPLAGQAEPLGPEQGMNPPPSGAHPDHRSHLAPATSCASSADTCTTWKTTPPNPARPIALKDAPGLTPGASAPSERSRRHPTT